MTGPKGERKRPQEAVYLGGMCAECDGRGTVSDLDLSAIIDEAKSLSEGAILVARVHRDGWTAGSSSSSGYFDPASRSGLLREANAMTSSTSRRSRSRSRASTSPTTG